MKHIEDKLIAEIAENGTDKIRELFLEWQEARIKGKQMFISKLEKAENNALFDISITMLKDWFTESDDGDGGKILMADCPNCGDAVVYNDGCIKCDANFEFK